MNIVPYARLLAKLFLDRRTYRGRSEFAFGFPLRFGRYHHLKVKAPGFRKAVVLRCGTSDIASVERVFLERE